MVCVVYRQIVKQSTGTVSRYARWEGKHDGMEIHTNKTTQFAAIISDTAKTFEVLPDSKTSKSSSFTSPTEVLQDQTD